MKRAAHDRTMKAVVAAGLCVALAALLVNLKAANALRLKVPKATLVRADDVIR